MEFSENYIIFLSNQSKSLYKNNKIELFTNETYPIKNSKIILFAF